eukprot:g4200.t1
MESVTLHDWKTAIDKIIRFHHHNNVLKHAVKGMGGMNFVKKINELHKQAEEERRAQEKKALEELRELRPKRKSRASIIDRFDNLQKLAKNTSPDKQRGHFVKMK